MWRRVAAGLCAVQWRRGKMAPRVSHCALSTECVEDEVTRWNRAMEVKYGSGAYKLFRPLYKDLADEMRREAYTKPPPPIEGWSVRHDEEVNLAIFTRHGDVNARTARIVAYAPIAVGNPPKLNDMLYFVDWYPIEVLMERNGAIVHFSVAASEGGMHMRNVRAYSARDGSLAGSGEGREGSHDSAQREALLSTSDDAVWVRHNLYYDGPCLWHLELDLQNELYDVMQDHGVTLDWVRWAAEWVYYLEHVAYVRWSLGMLYELIPPAQRGPEEDFLTTEEREALAVPVEDWLEAHYV
uniref:Uncharacterized protein TCIL3000_11_10100 n=1 Tax=Trypanosoma congolense (strain IL3000) TaxID=1068625 RepID=G0V1L7_TRYCI|nr:unnamed protein product [Trypanosoma congolense IL3000]